MRRPGSSIVDAIVRAADGSADTPHDVVVEPVELPGGPIRLLRPRDPDALPFETVSAPDAAVEELHPPHWARLWPSGTALARAVDPGGSAPDAHPASRSGGHRASRPDGDHAGAPGGDHASGPTGDRAGAPGGHRTAARERAGGSGTACIAVRGRSVLELGCGLGLPSLAAARAGARVLATDRSPDAAAHVAASAARDDIGLRSASCAWGGAQPLVELGPWDVLLAADVIYSQEALTVLARLLARLVADDGEVWLADPRRPLAAEFLADARDRWREVDTRTSSVPGVLLHRLRGPVRPG